jgi:TusA-related sulfurtransferase|uniref:Sulfurtransferase TusA family protein n=1 Tax=Desulfobacca acetoxidans TaxID=60893 RepID=A0A7C3UX25_9BACT
MNNFGRIRKVGSQALPGPVRQVDQRLDLTGVEIPFSLILCKATLARMEAGKILEVRLQDREALQDLLLILTRSGEQVLAWQLHQVDCYLWVRKALKSPGPGEGIPGGDDPAGR